MIMNCNEAYSLHGPYLDSELDAKTALEFQQHLAACAECGRVFAAESKLDAQITTGLKRGQRSEELWDQIGLQVRAAARANARPHRPARAAQLTTWWRELLWPCPQAWAGLTAVWVVVAAVNLATSGDAPKLEAWRAEPPSPEMRQVLEQQRQLLAELGGEMQRVESSPRPALRPRSQRREQLMNA
jgi:anti-sigma factor RsiW